MSAAAFKAYIPPVLIVPIKLFMFGEYKKAITVPESILREGLRKLASQEFQGRVAIQPEVMPVRSDSIVTCYPSFVPEIAGTGIQIPTVVPYLEHKGKLYPIEVPHVRRLRT
jgi:hypothetical protein